MKAEEVAARWWANALKEGITGNSGGGAFEYALAAVVTHQTPEPTEEEIDRFYNELRVRLENQSETLQVDYSPEGILAGVLFDIGMEKYGTRLPRKTNMNVTPKRVSVSCGYGAPWEVLYEGTQINAS